VVLLSLCACSYAQYEYPQQRPTPPIEGRPTGGPVDNRILGNLLGGGLLGGGGGGGGGLFSNLFGGLLGGETLLLFSYNSFAHLPN